MAISIGYPLTVFTTYPVSSLQFREVAEDFRNPMVQKWNVAVQQELGHQMALELGYQGNHSSHQLLQPDDNPVPELSDHEHATSTVIPSARIPISAVFRERLRSDSATTTPSPRNWRNTSRRGCSSSVPTLGAMLSPTRGTTLSGSQNFQTISNTTYSLIIPARRGTSARTSPPALPTIFPSAAGKQFGANLNQGRGLPAGRLAGQRHSDPAHRPTVHGKRQRFLLLGVWAGCFPDIVSGSANAAPAGGRTPSEWFNTANFTAPASLTQGNVGDNTNYGPPLRNLDALHIQRLRVYGALSVAIPGGILQHRQYAAIQFPGQRLRRCQFRQGDQHVAGNRTAHSVQPQVPVLGSAGPAIPALRTTWI